MPDFSLLLVNQSIQHSVYLLEAAIIDADNVKCILDLKISGVKPVGATNVFA